METIRCQNDLHALNAHTALPRGLPPTCASVDRHPRATADQRLESRNITEDEFGRYRLPSDCFVGICLTAKIERYRSYKTYFVPYVPFAALFYEAVADGVVS